MRILRYESSLGDLFEQPERIIFLAGPTVRGNQPHLTSWRFAAVEEFERQEFDGILVLPEFTERRESDKGKLWIPAWEFAGLLASDCNLFWIPRTRELIGLTTNHEKGYWLGVCPNKVVYGRPDDSYRNTYLDLMWQFHARQHGAASQPIHNTLEATVAAAIQRATECRPLFRAKSRVPVESPYGHF